MADEQKPQSREVALSMEWRERGLTARIVSRGVSAFDYLLGNGFDWVGYRLERKLKVERAKTEADVKLIDALADAAIRRIGTDDALTRRAVEAQLQEIVRKRENIEAVVADAHEDIKLLQPPTHPEIDPASETEELDADWLNIFGAHAERASSDGMRRLWGRILSGEIRQPKSFSLRTLRVVSELDAQTAKLFQELAVRRVGDDWIVRPTRRRGMQLEKLLDLEAAGLIQEVNGTLARPLRLTTRDKVEEVRIGSLMLRMSLGSSAEGTLSIPAITLSTPGKQLAAIISRDDMAVAKDIVRALSSVIETASVYEIMETDEQGGLTYKTEGTKLHPEA